MNIHDSMLFRWTGYDIEKPETATRRKELTVKPELTDEQVDDYLGRLREALNPKIGLKVSAYSDGDKVGHIPPIIKYPKPCLFFTEQAAGDLEEHWRLYGRLGFGFSKRFIFDCGGRPVIYAGGGKDPVLASIGYIRKTLSESKEFKDGHKIRQEFETLARFIKWTTPPLKKEDQAKQNETESETKSKTAQNKTKVAPEASKFIKPLEFQEDKPIRFLREREWRLIYRKSDTQRWRVDADRSTWFRPEAGKELQLIIVPCNLILHRAYEDKDIRKNLRGSSGITAQLISAQALRKL